MKEEKKLYQGMESLLNTVGDMNLNHKKGKTFVFQFRLSEQIENTSIDVLYLSERARNCLKRANIHTIGNLVMTAQHSSELKKLRNCGDNSVAEIMEKLFLFQYFRLKPERREQFLRDTVERNLGA